MEIPPDLNFGDRILRNLNHFNATLSTCGLARCSWNLLKCLVNIAGVPPQLVFQVRLVIRLGHQLGVFWRAFIFLQMSNCSRRALRNSEVLDCDGSVLSERTLRAYWLRINLRWSRSLLQLIKTPRLILIHISRLWNVLALSHAVFVRPGSTCSWNSFFWI